LFWGLARMLFIIIKKGDGSIFSLKEELPLQHAAHRLSFHSSLISQNK
jgi:hypothetical protein